MLKVLPILAHAEELHSDQTSTLEHYLTQTWVIVPLYLALLALIWFGLGKAKKWRQYRLLGLMVVSLVMAFISYSFAPGLAVTAIIIGFGSSLLMLLATASN